MSRHSKWAKIKRQKSVTDAKRAQVFTKLLRAVTAAARAGGGDPETNVRLRMAMDRALAENMPKDNLTRAVERAVGSGEGSAMESITVEGYGPGGAALLIEAVTDNRNRTVSEIRKLLGDAGGSPAAAGGTQWLFERRGRVVLEGPADPDAAELAAIDAGALDVDRDGTTLDILTPPDALTTVTETLTKRGIRTATSELILVPKQPLELPLPAYEQMHALVETLDDHEDIVDVVTNAVPAGIEGQRT
jgi:YebC/PmpR family DNA-binding regulatory protein